MEALQSNMSVERIVLRLNLQGKIIGDIIKLAKSQNVRIDRMTETVFDRKFMGMNSGGVIAYTASIAAVEVEDIIQQIESRNENPFLVILDGIEDPHNLGAIARSAEGAGCHGVIIPKRRSAPLSETALKVSAGALAHIPVAKAGNLAQTLEYLKKQDIWIFGADMEGVNFSEVDYPEKLALVIGAEGEGLSRLIKDKCDVLLKIPLHGKTASLNASVAAGILLFHIAGKRINKDIQD